MRLRWGGVLRGGRYLIEVTLINHKFYLEEKGFFRILLAINVSSIKFLKSY